MTWKKMVLAAAVVLLTGSTVNRNEAAGNGEAPLMAAAAVRPGYPAPALELAGLDGARYVVGGNREKPLLLNFWASWCDPCEEEAPDLARLYEKYKDKLDLYAVNATGNDELASVRAFAARHRFGFPVLLDYKLDSMRLYRYQVVPTSFLIDKNGMITDVIHLLEPDELEQKLKKLMEG
ncbi:MAG: TlpA family protein disulfide reductase [Paenibacillaceae bacterium]|jgi:thiol-disulfide isomerase/thioredoxin|nr:TlpA family protein disulfide reductase [Paenibacillaceae bacterium]